MSKMEETFCCLQLPIHPNVSDTVARCCGVFAAAFFCICLFEETAISALTSYPTNNSTSSIIQIYCLRDIFVCLYFIKRHVCLYKTSKFTSLFINIFSPIYIYLSSRNICLLVNNKPALILKSHLLIIKTLPTLLIFSLQATFIYNIYILINTPPDLLSLLLITTTEPGCMHAVSCRCICIYYLHQLYVHLGRSVCAAIPHNRSIYKSSNRLCS